MIDQDGPASYPDKPRILVTNNWLDCNSASTVDCVLECVDYEVIDFDIDFVGCSDNINTVSFSDLTQVPAILSNKLSTPMELFNGSVTTIQSNINNQIFNAVLAGGTGSTTANTIYYYGVISGGTYSALSPTYTAETNVFGVDSVDSKLLI